MLALSTVGGSPGADACISQAGPFLDRGVVLLMVASILTSSPKKRAQIRIRGKTHRTQEHRYRKLPRSVYTNIHAIVGVRLKFQPCTPVWNHRRTEEVFTRLILRDSKINARASYKL